LRTPDIARHVGKYLDSTAGQCRSRAEGRTQVFYDKRLGRKDGNRETLLFGSPAIKLSSGSPSVGGTNQDVMIQAGFTPVRHVPLGTFSVGRFWYLPTS
jgi:hypothetical protein